MASGARLVKLRMRPQYAHMHDDTLEMAIDTAVGTFESYTNRADPGTEADSVIIELACIVLNRLGGEGSSSATEGGVSRSWDSLPESIRVLMDRWRRPSLPRKSA